MSLSVARVRNVAVAAVIMAVVVSVMWMAVAQRASAASATPVVYVATGENFPDALGASSAAAVQAGPVLLVTKTAIPAETKTELTRLAPDVIYVAGGTAVVSDAVFDALKAYAPTVTRVAGANRYATAVEVSKSAFPVTGGGGDTAALEAAVAALTTRLDTLESEVAALESENNALKTKFSGVYRSGDTLVFEGMNLQVVNGKDDTKTSNSLGNVIIGYNGVDPFAGKGDRDGSHYLIVGDAHTYTAYAGIVTGLASESLAPYASVTGGKGNHASAFGASVTGGSNNWATNEYASVSGGWGNTASGVWSSVLGGDTQSATTGHSTYPLGP
jgi:hypothetical protein